MTGSAPDQAPPAPFDIYIVGLGTVGVRQITREVEDALGRCREVLMVDPGFGVRNHIEQLCDKVIDLVPVSYKELAPRVSAYDRMTTAVLDAALDHAPIAFAVYGHPHVYVYPTMQIRRAAALLGLRVQVMPGISTLDALLIDVGLDPGVSGLQMYEATDILLRDRPLQPDVPLILWQVGAVETFLHSTAASVSARFEGLQRHLLRFYPAEHMVMSVFTSTFPLAPSLVESYPVGELATRFPRGPQGATIYIPPTELRRVVNNDLYTKAESATHLSKITRQTTAPYAQS